MSCSTVDQVIHPDEKSASATWPTYEQILEENYKGPKARIAIIRFIDKSVRGQENSQAGDGVTEMLRQAMLATNRYIVQIQKSSAELSRGQNPGDNSQNKKEDEIDLSIEGFIKEFKQGIAGAGEKSGGASYITLMVTVTNPRTNQILATERIRGKATDFGGMVGKGGGKLPEVFKDFSKTPMEKAIRIAIEDSTSFIVAKTPPESYRVLPVTLPKEPPKPPPVKVQPEVPLPPPPTAVIPPSPPLRMTQVAWDNVNLREGPGANYKVIGNVKKGTSLGILEMKGNWLHVRLEDGTEAWVIKSATSEASNASPSAPPPKPMPM
ncbi:MAG: SH3 domain-containing protein [Syntrophaceae bacterium]|nr:SH3 domain-containing protein [Syntrophaceae bacterium]